MGGLVILGWSHLAHSCGSSLQEAFPPGDLQMMVSVSQEREVGPASFWTLHVIPAPLHWSEMS